jgi:hypothetical protein
MMWITLLVMGALVVSFNVMGYDILFAADPWFGIASPFGIMLGTCEVAVLLWMSSVISEWYKSSRILKVLTIPVFLAFSFLCYSGINSYLTTLATAEIQKVEEVKLQTGHNEEYMIKLTDENLDLSTKLDEARTVRDRLDASIAAANGSIKDLDFKISERMLKVAKCDAVADCRRAVKGFADQKVPYQKSVSNMNADRELVNTRIVRMEKQLNENADEIRTLTKKSVVQLNDQAGTESNFTMKKDSYEKIVLSVTGLFGWVPENPFQVFIGFVSALIYPIYFFLNLFLSLNSEGNQEVRRKRQSDKEARLGLFQELRLDLEHHKLNQYRKAAKYFRVWAARRTKIKSVEKLVEVEVPTDTIVEKRVEVPVEVIKIQKVTEQVVIKEPEVIIHERLVPVPENASAAELKELLNEEPRSDATQSEQS